MKKITNMLLDAGWKKCGEVRTHKDINSKNGTIVIDFSPRKRFCRGTSDKCTIGKLTVCFYSTATATPSNFRRYKTSDIKTIGKEIEQSTKKLTEKYVQPQQKQEKEYSNG